MIAARFYRVDTRPTLADRVRLRQRVIKLRARAGERVLRRASTLSRAGTVVTGVSRRAVGRSGYAFAHQAGFGELIMSGSMITHHSEDTETNHAVGFSSFQPTAAAAAAAHH